jgi:hypothetical protein
VPRFLHVSARFSDPHLPLRHLPPPKKGPHNAAAPRSPFHSSVLTLSTPLGNPPSPSRPPHPRLAAPHQILAASPPSFTRSVSRQLHPFSVVLDPTSPLSLPLWCRARTSSRDGNSGTGTRHLTRRVRVRGRFFTRGWHSYPTQIKTGTGQVFFLIRWVPDTLLPL